MALPTHKTLVEDCPAPGGINFLALLACHGVACLGNSSFHPSEGQLPVIRSQPETSTQNVPRTTEAFDNVVSLILDYLTNRGTETKVKS